MVVCWELLEVRLLFLFNKLLKEDFVDFFFTNYLEIPLLSLRLIDLSLSESNLVLRPVEFMRVLIILLTF